MPRDESQRHSSISFWEVISASLLWSGFVYAFVRPTAHQFVFAAYIGAFPSMLLNALGIAVVLLFVGAQGKKKKPRVYFVVLAVIRLLRLPVAFFVTVESSVQVIPVVYYLSSGASYALFVVAWCQHYSEKSNQEKSALVAPSILLSLAFVFTLLLLPFVSSTIACVVMQVSAIALILLRKQKPYVHETETHLSLQRRLVFLVFGVMIGFLLVACPSMVSDKPFDQISGSMPFYLWIIFTVFLALVSFMLPRKYPQVGKALQQLLPLLALGLLAPPFLAYGLEGVFPGVVAFVALGEMIVFSIGSVGTYFSASFAGRFLVFWERSIVLLGFMVGTIGAPLIIAHLRLSGVHAALIVAAVAYSALCLMTVSLSSKKVGAALATDTYQWLMSSVVDTVALSYTLTPREKEVFSELAQGRSVPYIQEKLFISEATVSSHIHHIYQKLEIRNRQELHDIVQEHLSMGK